MVFLEAVAVFPVDGAAAAVEQARLRQCLRAGAERAHGDALAAFPPEPGQDAAAERLLDPDTTRDDEDRVARHLADRLVHLHADAVRGDDGGAGLGDEPPFVEGAPGHAIGDAQRLDGAGEGNKGEVLQKEKYETLGPGPIGPRRRQAGLGAAHARM